MAFKRNPPPRKEREIKNYRRVMEQLAKVPGVTVTAPLAEGRIILRYGTQAKPATLTGIIPDRYQQLVDFRSKIIGDADGLKRNTQTVIVGKLLADNLGIAIGNRVNFIGKNGGIISLRVVGLYSSGVVVNDETRCYCPLRTAQVIHDLPSSVTRIALKVKNVGDAIPIARAAERASGLEAQSWQEANANFWGIFRVQNIVTGLNVFCTLLVAGGGIANSLITLVLEKTRDIGILKAIGLTRRQVGSVFLVEGLVIAVIGAIVGVLLGSRVIEIMSHTPMRGRGFIALDTFPMLKVWWVYATSAGFAVFISLLAALFPVLKAASHEPVEIIRYAK
jgi:ABC-type lipoprotein release transport system permease subunit